MKAVFDTNIFVSALMRETGVPRHLYQYWKEGRFEIVTSSDQIDEIRRVSRYYRIKTRTRTHFFGRLINTLKRNCLPSVLPPLPNQLSLNDPADEFLLATALAADADYLVTGDARSGLLALGRIGRTQIVTARVP